MKAWAVVWTEKAAEFYGAKTKIIGVEPKEEIAFDIRKTKMGRPKIRYGEPLAIFESKIEAEAFRAGNKDWQSVQITVSFDNG